jgi:hypothetical protein
MRNASSAWLGMSVAGDRRLPWVIFPGKIGAYWEDWAGLGSRMLTT